MSFREKKNVGIEFLALTLHSYISFAKTVLYLDNSGLRVVTVRLYGVRGGRDFK